MNKPGYMTTEFWIAVAIQIIGILAITGIITPDQSTSLGDAAQQLGGLVAMVGASFGYSLSRASVKKAEMEKKIG